MTKHIVIDARDYSSSTGRYVSNLISNLEKLDTAYRYTILLLPRDEAEYTPTSPNFTKLVAPFGKFSLDEQTKFVPFLKELKPDLTHFASTTQPLFYRGKRVTTIHDLTPLRFNLAVGRVGRCVYPLKKKLLNLMLQRAGKKSVAVLTGTNFVKQDLVDTLKIQGVKITIAPESADIIADKPEVIDQLKGKQFIFYVGRAQAHKNIAGLLAAFEKVIQTNPEVTLVLAGKKDAAYQYLEQLAQRNGIKNVLFTNFVSEGELHWLYKNATAYVFPSFSEGFGLPGLEALAHGTPLLSSNATCLPEVYGDAALYFNPENTEDMTHKIDRILRDTRLQKDLVERGKEQVGKYSWRRMAEQTLKVYNDALGS